MSNERARQVIAKAVCDVPILAKRLRAVDRALSRSGLDIIPGTGIEVVAAQGALRAAADLIDGGTS